MLCSLSPNLGQAPRPLAYANDGSDARERGVWETICRLMVVENELSGDELPQCLKEFDKNYHQSNAGSTFTAQTKVF